jgi:hypothetical protein
MMAILAKGETAPAATEKSETPAKIEPSQGIKIDEKYKGMGK